MGIKRDIALVRLPNKASTDLTGKEGYVVVPDSGLKLAATADLAKAFGVIVEGGTVFADVAVIGAFGGTVGVKLGGQVAVGDKLKVNDGGTVSKYEGSGTVVGVALESGVSDEIVEAALAAPAVVDPSGSIAAALATYATTASVTTAIATHAALTTGVHGMTV